MIELNANKKVEEIVRYSAEYSPYRNDVMKELFMSIIDYGKNFKKI